MYRTVAVAACVAAALAFGGTIAALAGKPTDPQIAHIAYTAGQLDIEAGKQALDKSKNKDMRAFAKRMIGDHTAVNDQALALVKKLNVTPEENPTSQSLTQAADAERKKLAGLDGAAFDKAYIDNEVAYHKTVNEALSKTLIPDAQKRQRILRELSVIDIDDYRERLMAGSEASQSPEAETMRKQIAKLLECAIANLPEAFRPVFMLREIEGLSVDETAAALQIPASTVKTRLPRSRRILQRELDPEIREALRDTFPFAGGDCNALTERVLAKFLTGPASK
jgi:putative membrane protein